MKRITEFPLFQKKVDHSGNGKIVFGKSEFNVTHIDKIFFPEEKITKGDVIEYYISIANYILPYLRNRPLSLFRNPGGISEPGFFQKNVGGDVPDFASTYEVMAESTGEYVKYIVCNNLSTLVYLINMGCIEINPWHSTIKSPDNPDYMIIDLDPSESNSFEEVIEVALAVKEIFDKAGTSCYCKTSGATGMHIYVPAGKKYGYNELKSFAHKVCILVNRQMENVTTMERTLSKRDRHKIYLDYLQNSKSQTIAACYCLRPRPGATVSTPLDWKEVKFDLSPHQFTINNVPQRIRKKGDIFSSVFGKGLDLKKCRKNLNF
jgi:bifunctional non-homologous end joining protein LigD